VVELNLQGESVRLPRQVETALFRIVQEAMTNVAKHANASRVDVSVSVDSAFLSLIIQDNGLGFDRDRAWHGKQPGWGIVGIRERAKLLGAECRIDSAPGKGTRIEVRAPLTSIENVHVYELAP
jgi:signal transduction histidine kinase